MTNQNRRNPQKQSNALAGLFILLIFLFAFTVVCLVTFSYWQAWDTVKQAKANAIAAEYVTPPQK